MSPWYHLSPAATSSRQGSPSTATNSSPFHFALELYCFLQIQLSR